MPTYRGFLHSETEMEQNTDKTSLNYVAISWELAFLLPCGCRAGVGEWWNQAVRLGIRCLYLLNLVTGLGQS